MLRSLVEADIPKLLVIEIATQKAPWTEEIFKNCLRAGCMGWAIEQENVLVGFVIFSIHAGENHILNICVHPDYQRQGLGRQLITQALVISKEQNAGITYLEVRCSNQGAIILYREMGFKQIGVRKDYYPTSKGREDAWIFAKDIYTQ